MRFPRGLGPRLSLALAGVVAAALAISYLIVVPSLRAKLVGARLANLDRAGHAVASRLPASQFQWADYLEKESAHTNARVVVYAVDAGRPPTLRVIGDSHQRTSQDVATDALAQRAVERLRPVRGQIERDGDRYAEVALPLPFRGLALTLSSSLHDSLADVDLVQRRLLLAGGIALVVAAAFGYIGSWAFARRIRRLERAADRIARGEFEESVRDRGADEVGALAAAFERMRERLAQLDHARREFIANASHELRTPLFSLGGFLELLEDDDLDAGRRREFVTAMAEQVRRLSKLATELLDLSRLDAGRLHLEREPVDLAALARATVDEFGAVAQASGLRLEAEAPEEVAALADEQRVLQIARNLIENAVVHARAPVHVRVLGNGALAVLEVADEGPGIPPEHVKHVFERFYRLEGTVASGSGLGLAIARELAQLMGGRLEVESEPGRTVFRLSLPAAAALDAGAESAAVASA